MKALFANIQQTGKLCYKEFQARPSYVYDFSGPPSQCCTRQNNSRIPWLLYFAFAYFYDLLFLYSWVLCWIFAIINLFCCHNFCNKNAFLRCLGVFLEGISFTYLLSKLFLTHFACFYRMTAEVDSSPLPRLSTGTSITELFAMPIMWSLSMILRNMIVDRINPRRYFTVKLVSFNVVPLVITIFSKLFILDFKVFILPQLLIMTLWADFLKEAIGGMLLLLISIKFIVPLNRDISQQGPQSELYTYYR